MSDLLKRRGIFKIDGSVIHNYPETATEVLKDVLLVRIDNDFTSSKITYYGYSKYFDLLDDYMEPPEYCPEIHTNENHEVDKVTWHRQKEYSEQDVKSMLQDIKKEIADTGKGVSINDMAAAISRAIQTVQRKPIPPEPRR